MKVVFILVVMIVGINLTGCASLPSDSTMVPGERVPMDARYD